MLKKYFRMKFPKRQVLSLFFELSTFVENIIFNEIYRMKQRKLKSWEKRVPKCIYGFQR